MENQKKVNMYPDNTVDQIRYLKSIIKGKVKISIIVPVYNVENYIENALESIVRQSIGLEHLEVVMVNDRSTDKSGEIIDRYASKYKNFKAIHLPENSGAAGKPRNVGIEETTGDYLMFLDPDDYYADNACEILYDKITSKNVDIVFSNYIYVFKTKTAKYNSVFKDIDEINVKKIDDNPQLFTVPPSIWTKIFKRSFIVENNIKFPEGIPGQDLVFLVHSFLKAEGIIYLNNRFLCYYNRIRDSKGDKSLSRDKNKKNLMGMAQAYHKTYDIISDYGKKEFIPIIFNGHLQFWTDGFVISDTNTSEKKELLKEISVLFEEFNRFNVIINRKYLVPLFNDIGKRKYDEAILLSELIRDFIKSHESLNNEKMNLQKRLNVNRIELNKLHNKNNEMQRLLNLNKELDEPLIFETQEPKNVFKKFIIKRKLTRMYNKLTVIIPYRKTDDPERDENLDITLRYLSQAGIRKLIISEHSDHSAKNYLMERYKDLFKFFKVLNINANGNIFNKAIAINNGFLNTETPYVAIIDMDCLTKKKNINYALDLLKNGYDVVLPFNWRVTDIVDKKKFKEQYDFKTVKSPEQNRPSADGGIVFWNKRRFMDIGMKNEYFSGWGGEDNEIIIRANIFGLKQYRINDTLYHLYHYRPQERPKNNVVQLQKTKQMKDKEACLKEINDWPWVIEAKRKLKIDNNNKFFHNLIYKFPNFYILINRNNSGVKGVLANIKGYKAIKQHQLFDIDYYLNNSADVKLYGVDPIIHYIYHGYKEGRNPNPAFDSDYYLNKYSDVKKSNLNPLVHYSLYGINEGRKTKRD